MTNFANFYGNVKHKDTIKLRAEFEKLASPQSFRNWEKGIYEPDARFWSSINEIAERYGYDKPYQL